MTDETTKLIPPHVSYPTFKNSTRSLSHGGRLPNQIDNSVFPNMSGTGKAQYFGTLRYFELIDSDGTPQERLGKLANSSDPEWKEIIGNILPEYYPKQLKVLEDHGTLQQLKDSFGDVSSTTLTAAIRFFLAAAKEAGVEVPPAITKATKGTRSRRGLRKPKGTNSDTGGGESITPDDTAPEGMIVIPVHRKGKLPGKILMPDDFDESDIPMIEIAFQMLKVYATDSSGVNTNDE